MGKTVEHYGQANTCKACGKVYHGHFCPECGTKNEEEMQFCPVCGVDREGAKFCANCGYEYERVREEGTPQSAPAAVVAPRKTVKDVWRATIQFFKNMCVGIWGGIKGHWRAIAISAAGLVVLAVVTLILVWNISLWQPLDENIEYKLEKNGWDSNWDITYTLHIRGEGDMPALNSSLKDGQAWKRVRDQITQVKIYEGVKSISEAAFYGCMNLTEVKLPDGLECIGKRAFSLCVGLEALHLPSTVTLIDDYAFSGCVNLSSINIPASVKTLGESAFYGCTSIRSFRILSTVTCVEERAFSGCTALKTIYCDAKERPNTWSEFWNKGCDATVVWGYQK